MSKSVFYIVFILISFSGFAQDEQKLYNHRLNENKWTELKEGIRYEGGDGGAGREWTYEDREEYEDAVEEYGENQRNEGSDERAGTGNNSGQGSGNAPQEQSNTNRRQSSNSPSPFVGLGWLGWVLMVVFGIGLAFLIYYLFVNREQKGSRIIEEVDLENQNPTEIPLTELQRLLQEAITRGDYRGAVRIYFIFIVRDLAQKNWIHWQKEKTNFLYGPFHSVYSRT